MKMTLCRNFFAFVPDRIKLFDTHCETPCCLHKALWACKYYYVRYLVKSVYELIRLQILVVAGYSPTKKSVKQGLLTP